MTEDQFWNKVALIPFHECFEWLGATNGIYGIFGGTGRPRGYAHRFSWEIHNKKRIPKGLFVMHSCDNPRCVNPNHLSLGTPKDNMQDMYKKGRSKTRPGMLSPTRKLTEKQVFEIRSSSLSTRKAGILYEVSPTTISNIRNKTKWKHLI